MSEEQTGELEIKGEWAGKVRHLANESRRMHILGFNDNFAKAIKLAPLHEYEPWVYSFFGKMEIESFFHVFSGFVGIELEFEDMLVEDLRAMFKKARMEKLERELGHAQPP